MKQYRTLFFALCLAALIIHPHAAIASELDQLPPPPIEWGKIPRADLEMKTFPKDTNASAVVLCEYGQIKVNDELGLDYAYHLRVKILDEKGFRWGTHSVSLYDDKEDGETIRNIEAVTYVLDKSGSVVEHHLNKRDIFKEDVSKDRVRYKFTLPALQPGCVIELRYEIVSKSLWNIRPWVFQNNEPVLWSEYRLLSPVMIAFTTVVRGFEKLAIFDQSDPTMIFSGATSAYFHDKMLRCYFRRWAMKDVPAMRDEPYITTLDDYLSKVDVQLAGYALTDGGVRHVLNTWEKLASELLASKYVGDKISTSGDVKERAQQVTAKCTTQLEKMKAIYAWVAGSIVWDGSQTIYAEQSMDDVLEHKKGNSADINYLLISLLQAAELEAEPIVMSTRAHGKLMETYPLTRQFNLAMARVTVDTVQYFLDATDCFRPFNIVPAKTIGVRALVVQDADAAEWVTVQSTVTSIMTTYAKVSLDEAGTMKGTIDGVFKNYANINIREALRDTKPTEVAKEYFALGDSRVIIDSGMVINSDSLNQPLTMKVAISSESFGQSGGDLLYVNPHIVRRWKDNPFKSANRKFIIDYNYPREYASTVKLTIPDSFAVKEVPPDKYLSMKEQVTYRRQFVVHDSTVELMTRFNILNKDVAPEDYARLKDLYARMIQSEAEQIVLEKKRRPSTVAAPVVPAAAAAPSKSQMKKKH